MTNELLRHNETGMIKVKMRDAEEGRTFIADLGDEGGMYAIDNDELERDFSPVNFEEHQPATSGHSVSAIAAEIMAGAREGDEEQVEEASEDFAAATEATPEEIKETYVEPATNDDPDAAAADGETTLTGDLGVDAAPRADEGAGSLEETGGSADASTTPADEANTLES